MSKFIKEEIKNIEISGIRKFNQIANTYKGVIKLTIGELDFDTPQYIKENAIKAINKNRTRYTENKGIKPLRTQIAKKYKHYTSDEVILTVGTTEALGLVIKSVISEGDEVIIKAPGYVGYEPLIHLENGTVKLIDEFTPKALKNVLSDRTKMILTTSPNNPTGQVIDKVTMDYLKDFVLEHNLLLVSDEIYSDICFTEYHSFGEYEVLKQNLIILNGFSKSHAMTGFRLGYLVSDQSIVDELVKVHQYNVTSTSTISQYAALDAIDKPFIEMVSTLKRRRDIVLEVLDELGLTYYQPDGAFYVFFNIAPFKMDSEAFCLKFLEEYNVALIPGEYFLGNKKDYVRLSYAVSEKSLLEALQKLREFKRTI